MKLTYEQLSTHLKEALLPIYLISGDETLLVNNARDYICQQSKQHHFDEHLKLETSTHFDWDQFSLMLQTRSLLANKRLIELTISGGKPGIQGSKMLQNYAKKPFKDVILLIITPKLDSTATQSAWFKSINTTGATLAIWPIEPKQFPQWIKMQLQKANLTMEPLAIQFLCDCVEGNLLAAKQEIDKLSLQYGHGHLTLKKVEEALSDHSHYDIFTLVDYALQGDTKYVIKILANLENEGVEPILILWGLCKELRTIANIQFDRKSNPNLVTLFQQYQVWSKRQPIIKQALNRITYNQALHFIQQAATIDRMIKGIETGNSWTALTQLFQSVSHKL